MFHAQATPWSPSTNGPVMGADVIGVPKLKDERTLEEWKGKLRGKVILYGDHRTEVDPDKTPVLEHCDAEKLRSLAVYPLNGDMSGQDVMTRSTFGKLEVP